MPKGFFQIDWPMLQIFFYMSVKIAQYFVIVHSFPSMYELPSYLIFHIFQFSFRNITERTVFCIIQTFNQIAYIYVSPKEQECCGNFYNARLPLSVYSRLIYMQAYISCLYKCQLMQFQENPVFFNFM